MAYIIEQAGGKAHSGVKPILDIQPTSIHERAPIFIGSKENVDDYLKIREQFQKKWTWILWSIYSIIAYIATVVVSKT